MTPLPVLPTCSLRGERVSETLYSCSSEFLTHAHGAAHVETCMTCPFANWTCKDKPEHPTCVMLAERRGAEPPLPPTGSQVLSFLGSVASHLIAGLPQATEEVRAARLSLCSSCEFFRPSDGRCSLCGCFTGIKAQWQGEKCPHGKW